MAKDVGEAIVAAAKAMSQQDMVAAAFDVKVYGKANGPRDESPLRTLVLAGEGGGSGPCRRAPR
jgi:hypothetical protein